MKLEISNDIFFSEVEHALGQGQSVTITLRGNSMRPWLKDGKHKVVLRAHNREDIQPGAIMLFKHKSRHTLHRIRSIDAQMVTFAGDGNINQIEVVMQEDIIAIATSIIAPGGRVVDCTSREWRVKSWAWLTLPQTIRRVILGIARRL